ncbi:MAG: hypothetical protein K8R40_06530 [Anaerolineaceae bacterium]|nr:hypothetical protein [Anaerolineaceae bacterium]
MKRTNLRWLLLVIICYLTVVLVSCLPLEGDGSDEETIKNGDGASETSTAQLMVIPKKVVATATKQAVQATKTKAAIATLTGNLDECENSGGSVHQVLIPVSNNSKEMVTHIYLPPGYSENQDRYYPLLILLHGQSFTADQWLDLGLKEYLGTSFANQEGGVIVVLPEENDYLLPIIDSSFDDMIVNDLLKYLEENYHISPMREERAIGGISRGATWALKIALNHWEEFGGVGLHSYPGGVNSTILLIRKIPEGEIPAIFIDVGINDTYLNAATALNEELNEFRITHEWYLNEGSHTQEYWSENLSNYMEWYLEQLSSE